MNVYQVVLRFSNLDNNLSTDWQAKMTIELESDNLGHAHILAERLCKVLDADYYELW